MTRSPFPALSLPSFLATLVGTGGLMMTSLSAWAGLDIEESKSGDSVVWVVQDRATGKSVGTFWSEDGNSDFGYDAGDGITPEFAWSKDRAYVAVKGGYARSQEVFLYAVQESTLAAIEIPALSDAQLAPLARLDDIAGEGVSAAGWQADGTLLLHYWAENRVSSETEKQKSGHVWAVVRVEGATATILRTTETKP